MDEPEFTCETLRSAQLEGMLLLSLGLLEDVEVRGSIVRMQVTVSVSSPAAARFPKKP